MSSRKKLVQIAKGPASPDQLSQAKREESPVVTKGRQGEFILPPIRPVSFLETPHHKEIKPEVKQMLTARKDKKGQYISRTIVGDSKTMQEAHKNIRLRKRAEHDLANGIVRTPKKKTPKPIKLTISRGMTISTSRKKLGHESHIMSTNESRLQSGLNRRGKSQV